jgi:hypothetical protein
MLTQEPRAVLAAFAARLLRWPSEIERRRFASILDSLAPSLR